MIQSVVGVLCPRLAVRITIAGKNYDMYPEGRRALRMESLFENLLKITRALR
jgi:hypothetical protein